MSKKFSIVAAITAVIIMLLYWGVRNQVKITEQTETIKQLQTRVDSLENAVILIRNKANGFKDSLFVVTGRLAVSDKKNKLLEADNKALNIEIAGYKKQIIEQQQTISDLSIQKAQVTNELNELRRQDKITVEQKEKLQKDLNEINDKLKNEYEKNNRLSVQADSTFRKVANIQLDYSKDGFDYIPVEFGTKIEMDHAKKIRIIFKTVGNVEFKVQIKKYQDNNPNPATVEAKTFLAGECMYEFEPSKDARTYSIQLWNQDFTTLLFLVPKIIVSK